MCALLHRCPQCRTAPRLKRSLSLVLPPFLSFFPFLLLKTSPLARRHPLPSLLPSSLPLLALQLSPCPRTTLSPRWPPTAPRYLDALLSCTSGSHATSLKSAPLTIFVPLSPLYATERLLDHHPRQGLRCLQVPERPSWRKGNPCLLSVTRCQDRSSPRGGNRTTQSATRCCLMTAK